MVPFYDAPAWVFTLAYTLFVLLVAAAWWRYPPPRSQREVFEGSGLLDRIERR